MVKCDLCDKEESATGEVSEPVSKREGFRVSNFQDSECGEPAGCQHLRIDFTPIEGVDDNEYMMNKCRDFWVFIERNPCVKGLRVEPERNDIHELVTTPRESGAPEVHELTGTDWLKREDLMSEAFTTEHKNRYCLDGSGDYCTKKDPARTTVHRHPRSSISRRILSKPLGSKNLSSIETTALCKQLEAWDLSHPRSMEPPGHPPDLCHALMQRGST